MLARHKLPPEAADPGAHGNGGAREAAGRRSTCSPRFATSASPISIDDYGTGLSTLEYLKKIPASEIKIDQSFVKTMLENRSDLVMVQSTIALAHSLGRKVVAEGVEHQNVLDALIDMGCDVAQGYVIGRPMSIDSLTKRMSTERRSSVA